MTDIVRASVSSAAEEPDFQSLSSSSVADTDRFMPSTYFDSQIEIRHVGAPPAEVELAAGVGSRRVSHTQVPAREDASLPASAA